MKVRQITAILTLALLALVATACSSNSNPNSNSNSNSNAGSNANTKTSDAQTPENSPTAAFKETYAALQKKDVETIKKGLSSATLDMVAEIAKKQNRTNDETLRDSLTDPNYNSPTIPETRNEKITGDTATIEVKVPKTGQWQELPFVKEKGRWKIAYDKVNKDDMSTDNSGETMEEPSPSPKK